MAGAPQEHALLGRLRGGRGVCELPESLEIDFCSTPNNGHSEAHAGLPRFDPTRTFRLA